MRWLRLRGLTPSLLQLCLRILGGRGSLGSGSSLSPENQAARDLGKTISSEGSVLAFVT